MGQSEWSAYRDAMRAAVRDCGVPRTQDDVRALIEVAIGELRRRDLWTPHAEERLRRLMSND